ncbi:MAG: alpha-hydroxy-acid oxidizing protein [Intrasporangium sp.]|uniref:alpha-hydroxy-acid oxidizing protein n=1 Tax=Intrasporangium sp. TaxID=1925024 RepID=UPI002647DAE1|nr:alpha-hydroxy-acid oxidizing protein [Intrasporangium sp.]MDN5797301.1 alpha-hydroxy-acid oxidizing protein [Intrasporangium sp.]
MSLSGFGRGVQSAVYRAGALGHRPRVPTDGGRLEAAAERSMSRRAFAYVAGSAGSETAARENRTAFDRWEILPHHLVDASDRDAGVDLFGRRHPAPFLLAPIGALSAVHPDGDLAVARGARDQGVTMMLSSQASVPMEEVCGELAGTGHWFQLYWSSHDDLVASLVSRAEACGSEAVVVTLDTVYLGWRPRDLDLGHLPFARGEGIAQYTSDPVFQRLVADRVRPGAAGTAPPFGSTGQQVSGRASTSSPSRGHDIPVGGAERDAPRPTPRALGTLLSISRNHPGPTRENLRAPEPRAAVETFLDVFSRPNLSWADLPRLRELTNLPVVLKGILRADDARRALDEGVDAIYVSNHGGRQVDRSVAALDALVDVVGVVRDRAAQVPVLFDSGVRTGADAFLALALGASAVGIGRPHVYGLALAGEEGVSEVLRNLRAELDLTMALTGCRTLADITADLVRPRGSH